MHRIFKTIRHKQRNLLPSENDLSEIYRVCQLISSLTLLLKPRNSILPFLQEKMIDPQTRPQISACVSQLSSIKVHILINAIDLTAFAFTCVLLPWLLQPKSFCFINMLTKRFMQIMAVKYIFLIFKHLYLKKLPTESLNTLNAYGSSQNF